MDEGKARSQVDRGERAKRILESDLVKEAFEKIEAGITEGWQKSKPGDHEGRHNAYLMFRLLKNFKAQFEQVLTTGQSAQKQLLNTDDPKRMKVF